MKTNPSKSNQTLCLVLFLALPVLTLCSCAKTVRFATSTVVPAADGRVKIEKDDNDNYSVNVSIENLAPPSKLTPPKDVYVVWLETETDGTKNIGRLVSSSGFFSNALEATLTTVTPFKPTRIYVTAEKNATIQNPGSQVVITTRRF
ncbi:hypothetical protein [Pedobacter sp. SYSU D00535]|uniref:hypothetical protein n=1 Tax=Pedobacter sp. SYSU D00535 TaxID=2810308 RepID=UPI001F620B04|nr:hypothetical protein [Pedobacter sp. SYSU D00535]